jgi:pimeloyl-ACP methyl ester carboxylesterase
MTLLAPNRRRYHPRTPAHREDYRKDAADLLGLLAEPAHVVGHSYGAVVALLAATRMPRCVRSLTLVEPPPLPVTHHLPVVLPGAGHFVQRDPRFATTLAAFLDSLPIT